MSNGNGNENPESALFLLGGLLFFIATVVTVHWALVHYQVH